MNNRIPTEAQLVFTGDLSFLESKAREYKRGAIEIRRFDSNTSSFHLLSSLSFELFVKVLIGHQVCIKNKNDVSGTREDVVIISKEKILQEIEYEMRKSGHNLANLLNKFPELIEYLNIRDISEFRNGYEWGYRIEMNSDEIGLIKDIEGIRYGSLAKHKDILVSPHFNETIVEILRKLEKYVMNNRAETHKVLFK